MACGGTCGCDDCDADRRVLGPCVAAMACLSPDGAVPTAPIHPSGASKTRVRARPTRSVSSLTRRIAGDVRGAVTPPSHAPSIERSPYVHLAAQSATQDVPSYEPRHHEYAPEVPDGTFDVAAPDVRRPGAGASPTPRGERSLEGQEKTGPSVELGGGQKRGKGGGGDAPPSTKQPPQTPEGGVKEPEQPPEPPPVPVPGCEECKCECVPADSEETSPRPITPRKASVGDGDVREPSPTGGGVSSRVIRPPDVPGTREPPRMPPFYRAPTEVLDLPPEAQSADSAREQGASPLLIGQVLGVVDTPAPPRPSGLTAPSNFAAPTLIHGTPPLGATALALAPWPPRPPSEERDHRMGGRRRDDQSRAADNPDARWLERDAAVGDDAALYGGAQSSTRSRASMHGSAFAVSPSVESAPTAGASSTAGSPSGGSTADAGSGTVPPGSAHASPPPPATGGSTTGGSGGDPASSAPPPAARMRSPDAGSRGASVAAPGTAGSDAAAMAPGEQALSRPTQRQAAPPPTDILPEGSRAGAPGPLGDLGTPDSWRRASSLERSRPDEPGGAPSQRTVLPGGSVAAAMPPAHPGLAPGQRVLQPGGSPRASATSDPDEPVRERALERPVWQPSPEVAFPAGTKAGQSAHPFGLDDALPAAKSAPKLTLAPPEHPSAPDSAVLRPAGSRMSDVAAQLPGSAPPAPRFRAAPRSQPSLEAGPLSTVAAAGSSGPSAPASPLARTTTSAGSAARTEVATLDLARRGLATLSEGAGRAPEGLGGSSMLDTEMPSGGASRPPWVEPARDYYPQPARSAGGGSLGPAPMGASGASAGTGPTRGKGGGAVEAAARAQIAATATKEHAEQAAKIYNATFTARIEVGNNLLDKNPTLSDAALSKLLEPWAKAEAATWKQYDAAAEAAAAAGDQHDAAMAEVAASGAGQAEKRVQEAVARQSSEQARYRQRRDEVSANRQHAQEASAQRRANDRSIAANSSDAASKYLALASAAASESASNARQGKELERLSTRLADLDARAAKGEGLTPHEARERTRLKLDGPRREREARANERATARANKLEERRKAHVQRHGPAIVKGLHRSAARLDRDAATAAAKARATPSKGKRQRLEAKAAELAAQASALRATAEEVQAEYSGAPLHIMQHLGSSPLAGWSGKGCPPNARSLCCPTCGVGETCECTSRNEAAKGSAAAPTVTVAEPGRAPPPPPAREPDGLGDTGPHGGQLYSERPQPVVVEFGPYEPYLDCNPGTALHCHACRQARRSIRLRQLACPNRDDQRWAISCMLEALHSTPRIDDEIELAVERVFDSIGHGSAFKSRDIHRIPAKHLPTLRAALDAACLAHAGPPGKEELYPTIYSGGASLEDLLAFVGAVVRAAEGAIGDALVGLFQLALAPLKELLPESEYDALIGGLLGLLEPLMKAGAVIGDIEQRMADFLAKQLDLGADAAYGLAKILTLVIGAGMGVVRKLVAKLKALRPSSSVQVGKPPGTLELEAPALPPVSPPHAGPGQVPPAGTAPPKSPAAPRSPDGTSQPPSGTPGRAPDGTAPQTAPDSQPAASQASSGTGGAPAEVEVGRSRSASRAEKQPVAQRRVRTRRAELAEGVHDMPDGSRVHIDADGLTTRVEVDNLVTDNPALRNKYLEGQVGQVGGPGYEGGHLFGRQFGGASEVQNLVPMTSKANREFLSIERDLAATKAQSGRVSGYSVEVDWGGSRDVPRSFTVRARIQGTDGTTRIVHEVVDNAP
jgi:hypothetical protein